MSEKKDNVQKEWISTEVKPFLAGFIFHAPLESMVAAEIAEAWVILDFIEKFVIQRKKALRERLLNEAEENGTETDKGGKSLVLNGIKVTREKRIATEPDEKQIEDYIMNHDIPIENVFDEVKTRVLNPSKLEGLIKTGYISRSFVESTRKITWALKMTASKELKIKLENAQERVKELASFYKKGD
jgi:hypothetical protein